MGRNKNILIVSNNHHRRGTYISGLHGYGYDVQDTHNFEGACILMRAGYIPNVVFIDMKFHGQEACDFMAHIHHRFGYNRVQIIMAGNDDLDRGRASGANAFLFHPVTLDDLLHVM